MKSVRINADKPHLWKADIAASVDQFNQWFMRFAPEAFRSTRVKTTERVKAALLATEDLRQLNPDRLKANPGALSTLRMCTAPPLAVDRLIGLASVSKSLIGRMEAGKLAVRMKEELLLGHLNSVCEVINKLLDRDIFPWLDARKSPTDHERDRAATIVADRLCSAVANPIVRNAQEQRQLALIGEFLEKLGYRKQGHAAVKPLKEMEPGTYAFRMNLPVGKTECGSIASKTYLSWAFRGMIAQYEKSVESRREAIQTELDARRSKSERNRLGQFATPNALAIEIARYVESIARQSLHTIRFADSAVGTGSFYSAALAVFGPERIQQAIGIEIDPTVCDATRGLWRDAGLDVVTGDFTRIVANASRATAPNLILANPPYIRHHHLEREEKERLKTLVQQMTGDKVNGLAGLYVYFLLLATAWMKEGGYAAWLVPSEFMDVNYGAAVKRFLAERVTLLRVHRFDPNDVQFGDVLVSSVVLVFRKSPPPPAHAVEFTFGGTIAVPSASDLIPLAELQDSRKWTVYPRHAKNDRHTSSDNQGPMLGDFFRIQRGIATGSNKFFVLDHDEAQRRRFPSRYLRPILPSPRHLRETVIESDAKGYPLIEPQLCVIDCDLPAHILKERHSDLWEYLETAEALGIKDGYLIRKRTPWYKQEQREPAPFLCTYMGRGSDEKRPFRFIWNRSKAIATNLFLMLYPRKALGAMLREHPDRASEVFQLLGDISGHELRGEGRVYGGGLNKIEPHELGRISAAAFLRTWPELGVAVERQSRLFS